MTSARLQPCPPFVVLCVLQKKRVVVMDLRNDYEWDAGRVGWHPCVGSSPARFLLLFAAAAGVGDPHALG
jgi:hypothetical protein